MTYVSCGVEKIQVTFLLSHDMNFYSSYSGQIPHVELGYLGLLCKSYHNTFKYANKPVNRDLVVAVLKGVRQSFC